MVLPRGEKGKKEAALAWIQRRALLWWWWRGWRRPRDDPARKTTVAVLLLWQCLSQPVFGSPNCKEEGKVRNAHQHLYQGPLDAWYRPNKVDGEWVCISIDSLVHSGVLFWTTGLEPVVIWVLVVSNQSSHSDPWHHRGIFLYTTENSTRLFSHFLLFFYTTYRKISSLPHSDAHFELQQVVFTTPASLNAPSCCHAIGSLAFFLPLTSKWRLYLFKWPMNVNTVCGSIVEPSS